MVLKSTVHRLLLNRPRDMTLVKIAGDTGLGIEWLSKFSSDKITDPGAARLERLYKYLSGKELEIQ